MASKRPNKQQRQRQNRQQREARRARSVRAGEATAIARGEREVAEPTAGSRGAGKTAGAKTAGAKAAAAQSARKQRYSIPGQRAIVMAFLFTLVSAATLLIAPVQVQREVDPDDPVLETIDEDEQEVDEEAGTVTYVEDAKLLDEEGPAVAAGVILTPILITGAAVWFTKRPQRSTVWTMAMVALAAYIFLFAGPYGIITLPSMIAVAVGGFQSRRAESKERLAELRAKKAAAADGEVIDVEATEADAADLADDPGTIGLEDDGHLADPAAPVSEDDRR